MKGAIVVLCIIAGLLIAAPLLTQSDPAATDAELILQSPSSSYILGTDHLGRDVWARLLAGGRLTLVMNISATVIAMTGSVLLGIVTTLSGDYADRIGHNFLTGFLAFPPIVFALMLLTVMPRGAVWIALAAGISQIAGAAYLLKAETRRVLLQEYITAAVAIGASRSHVLWQHVLLGMLPMLTSVTSLTFGYTLMTVSTLSFLGLGVAPGVPEWGVMLVEGRNAFRLAPWAALAPGLAIMIVILSVQRLADWTAETRR